LLFTNAGMNQFKDVFLGKGTRDYTRAVNSQKCIRVSGKHNDLEEVGPSPVHHTFFEMLGNWSFGDYYKAEAIRWAWELLTGVYGLDKTKLYATVFTEDDDAHRLWESETDIDPSHISRHGHKDNFWEMGEIGPCGPCSEIHYDLGEPLPGRVSPPDDGPNSDSGRFIELWNLVFIQYFRDEKAKLNDLPATHVDTGAGLERIARVMQGVDSNYGTDLFRPVITAIEERSGIPYDERNGVHIPHRVIADHLRALSFAVADGALPGNEGRGYVLRRILRRAARFVRQIGINEPFIADLVPVLVDVMGEHFGELAARKDHIIHVLRAEEESFGRTLDRGLDMFEELTAGLEEGGVIAGKAAFRLYDTFGFPLDLTRQMARERGLDVDVKGFDKALEMARKKSREALKGPAGEGEFTVVTEGPHSEFVGYDFLSLKTNLRMVRLEEGDLEAANDPDVIGKPLFAVVLAKTPFYAESGGQVSDRGMIKGRELHLVVEDVRREGDLCLHFCRAMRLPKDGEWPSLVEADVDQARRSRILPHHTTTHLLQAALRETLGEHVTQAGSRVGPDSMTFDFTHFEKLSPEQIARVEARVNRWIREDHPVTASLKSLEEAKTAGAMALFGEKYGSVVRVITVGEGKSPVSLELCGGTHLRRTGEAGLFRIESESAVSAGVRRVECTAGEAAYERMTAEREALERVADLLGSRGSDPAGKLARLIERQKAMEKEVERLKRAALQGGVRFVEEWGEELVIDGSPLLVVSGVYEAATDRDGLQSAGDKIIEDLKKAGREGIGLIGAPVEETFMFVAVATPGLVKKGVHAGKLVGAFAKRAGGGGGGKANFATAGSRDLESANALLRNRAEVLKFVRGFLAE
ncbi:MAG TPA: alanine--tRNA ligase, partial [Bacteroidetes bacterium]|nr:alanine--tRNA ligase [Bacteroidota bacterium]